MVLKWTHLSFFSIVLIFLLALVLPPHLVGQSTINFAQNGGVADHVGITFGGCQYDSSIGSQNCSFTQPVTCSTVAGSNQYTISGYTPTSDDVGKHLIIGMSYGINGNTSVSAAIGAGGSKYAGQPLRVLVQSVAGNTITGEAFQNGSPSADAVNSVTNAECDLETDNAPALQALVDTGDNVNIEIPAGNWGFDLGVLITKNNVHITCDKGAVIYDARNDTYFNNPPTGAIHYFMEKLFSWDGTTGGGMSGCTYVGTNTALKDDVIPKARPGLEPNANQAILSNNSTGLSFSNLIGMNMWSDAFIWLGGNENFPVNGLIGTNNSTVANTFIKNGWAFSLAMVFGSNNTFSNITTVNGGPDLEPDTIAEANLTYGNKFVNIQSSRDDTIQGGMLWVDGSCQKISSCLSGQSVNNVTISGRFLVYPACTSSGTIDGVWHNVTLAGNASGSPSCFCLGSRVPVTGCSTK